MTTGDSVHAAVKPGRVVHRLLKDKAKYDERVVGSLGTEQSKMKWLPEVRSLSYT